MRVSVSAATTLDLSALVRGGELRPGARMATPERIRAAVVAAPAARASGFDPILSFVTDHLDQIGTSLFTVWIMKHAGSLKSLRISGRKVDIHDQDAVERAVEAAAEGDTDMIERVLLESMMESATEIQAEMRHLADSAEDEDDDPEG